MEVFEVLGINWKILLGQIINFFVLLYLMKKFVLKEFLRILKERKEKIERIIFEEKEMREKLFNIEKEKERVLQNAQEIAEKIIEEAKEKAKEKVEKMLEEAEKTKKKIIEEGKKLATNQIEEMKKNFYQKNLELVFLIVEKILKEKIDKEKDMKIIQRIFQENEK